MSEIYCNECSHTIDRKKERYTICEGKCAQRYHAACVGLTDTTVAALFSKNILWMCDSCLANYCSTRDTCNDEPVGNDVSCAQSTVETDIAELKTAVSEIFGRLATLASHSIKPQLQYDTIHQRIQSTPNASVSRDDLLDGMKPCVCDELNVNNSLGGVASIPDTSGTDNTFSLFLTNIECRTTENDVQRLVRSSLEIDYTSKVKVRKLIPRGLANDELDYVSFKITLDSNLKCIAMKPTTWPIGVKFREFENRRLVWRPLT